MKPTLRWIGCLLVIVAALVCIAALLTAIEPFYHSSEERDALRAFERWRESPSPETEKAYVAASEKALREEMKLRGAAALVGAVAGIGAAFGAHRLMRASRRGVDPAEKEG